MNRMKLTATALLIAASLAACSSKTDASKENFKTALQTYYSTTPGVCVSPPGRSVPFELETKPWFTPPSGITLVARADALVDAGLLTRSENLAKKMFVYNLTAEGQKHLTPGAGTNRARGDAFCTGKVVIKEVTSFTAPADLMGFRISEASYSFHAEGMANWVKTPALAKANQEIAKRLRGELETNKAVLRLTSEGWVHDRTKAK